MRATSIVSVTWNVAIGTDATWPLLNRRALRCPTSPINLVSLNQVAVQNRLEVYMHWTGQRHFITGTGCRIPFYRHNGLNFLPTRRAPSASLTRQLSTQATSPGRLPAAPPLPPPLPAVSRVAVVLSATSTGPDLFDVGVTSADLLGMNDGAPDLNATARAVERSPKPLAQLCARLGVGPRWIVRSADASIVQIQGARSLSHADDVLNAHLSALSGQKRAPVKQSAGDLRAIPRLGEFSVDYDGPWAIPSIRGSVGSHDFMDGAVAFGITKLVPQKGGFAPVLRHTLLRDVLPHIDGMTSLTCDRALEYGWGPDGS